MEHLHIYLTRKQEETHTLGGREGHVAELLEEKDARYHWDQIHDEVIVHHAPRVQLQTFQVIRGEMSGQFGAAEGCEAQGSVSKSGTDHTFQVTRGTYWLSPWTSCSAGWSVPG